MARLTGSSLLGRGGSGTLVVAASDAPAAVKMAADYVCDGTADESEINKAITAAGSNGGIVQLSAGTFNIAATINAAIDGGGLVGMGMESTVLAPTTNSINVIEIAASDDFFVMGNFKISGVTGGTGQGITTLGETHNFKLFNIHATLVNVGFDFEGGNTFLGSFENCRVTTVGSGFIIGQGTTLTWTNCYVNSADTGWQIGNCKQATLIGCAGDIIDGWTITGDQAGSAGPEHLLLINFHFESSRISSGTGGGVRVVGPTNLEAYGFQVESCGSEAGAIWHTIQMQTFWEQRVSVRNAEVDAANGAGTNYGVAHSGSTGQAAVSLLYKYAWNADVSDNSIPSTLPQIKADEGEVTYLNLPVGVGVASTGELIHVSGDSDPTIRINAQTANSVNSGKLAFGETDSSAEQAWIKYEGNSNKLLIETTDIPNAVVVDRASGDVGIRTNSPDGTLHVYSAASGAAAANAAGDELVLEQNNNAGLSIKTPGTVSGYIFFSDPGANNVGYIRYNHNDDTLRFQIGGSERAYFTTNRFYLTNSIFIESTDAGITASTTQTQGQQALTGQVNEISTVANTNDTVTLPLAEAGFRCTIINNGANTLQIFPASGDDLGAGVDTATTLAAGSNVTYVAYDATNWETV